MPYINHNNFGNIQKHVYLTGVIKKVYIESKTTPEVDWDTADVLIDGYDYVWEKAPIFYHCYSNAQVRTHGGLVDAGKGFSEGDKVFVLCEIITPHIGGQRQIDNVKIIGHIKGPVKCAYNYIFVRCSLNPLEDLILDDITKNIDEWCIVFNVLTNELAEIVDPGSDAGLKYVFPCRVNDMKRFLLSVDFQGSQMWEEFSQGAKESGFEVAGGTPNWTTDLSGDDIRGSVEAKEWWTTYDINGNPVINLFEDLYLALMTDDQGASDGSYSKAYEVLSGYEDDISTWDSRSSGVATDKREYSVPGPKDLDISIAINTDGETLEKAESRSIQIAFGEDEIWVCAVNSYRGVIVSYCDSESKFVRLSKMPPNITIPYAIENWEKVATDAAFAAITPGSSIASGLSVADTAFALASDITLSGKGGENSIWSYATLKRVNEGHFDRTVHPAIDGSKALRSTLKPEGIESDPKYLSALNFRQDNIKAWFRYDNWNSTYGYITNSYGVSPPWWFRSAAVQFGCDAIFVDTPIGSMWFQAPNWKGFVYYLYALKVGSVLMTARKDRAIQQDFKYTCKHSKNVCCQIYVVQRTSITMWSNKPDIFVKQTAGVEPYATIPSDDGTDQVSYAKMPDGSYKHFDLLTEEEINTLVSDRIFLYTNAPDEIESLRQNRNEIEIMASVDMYSDLFADFGRENPADQERNPEFEACIAQLIQKTVEKTELKHVPFYIDMEIL